MAKLPGFFTDIKFGLQQLLAEFNGRIDVVDNLSIRLVSAVAGTVLPDTQEAVEHRLGRVPRGVITAGIEIAAGATSSVPGIIYFTDADRLLWTAEMAYLRYTENWNLHTVTLIFF